MRPKCVASATKAISLADALPVVEMTRSPACTTCGAGVKSLVRHDHTWHFIDEFTDRTKPGAQLLLSPQGYPVKMVIPLLISRWKGVDQLTRPATAVNKA